jgi:hypothetical protein
MNTEIPYADTGSWSRRKCLEMQKPPGSQSCWHTGGLANCTAIAMPGIRPRIQWMKM